MNVFERVSKAAILCYFEAKSTDNVVYWRAFSMMNAVVRSRKDLVSFQRSEPLADGMPDKIAILKSYKSRS